MRSDRFRAAVEHHDLSRLEDVFTDDVVFRSPAVFKPYEGRDAVGFILAAVSRVFEDFRYLEQVESGEFATLLFEARVGKREVQGVDLLWFAADDRIEAMTVMVRPLSGLNALVEAMERMLQGGEAA